MITIDWLTKIISVPKADTILVQLTPTEIRELDTNSFRLRLKEIESSEEGMPFLDTHRHNTEVSLGGITFARVIEIINGYTVTFEDGQYAINLTGSNNNIADVTNVNQVSIRSANSAGLISSPDIEFASFNGGVTIDVNSPWSGTEFPVGTEQAKVNNIQDALLIAEYRGFNTIYMHSDLILDNSYDFSGFHLIGKNHVLTELTISGSVDVQNVKIETCNVTGVLDGGVELVNCMVGDMSYVNGYIHDCGLYGTLQLDGNSNAVINNCHTIDQDSPPVIDMGGSGQSLAMPNYSGIVTIKNLDSADDEVGIGLNAGMVVLDPTVTAGTIIISGIGMLMDYATSYTMLNTDGLINKNVIASAVWDEPIFNHLEHGTTGLSVGVSQFDGVVTLDNTTTNSGTAFPVGTSRVPVNNLADAKLIAVDRGINVINVESNLTVQPGESISGYVMSSTKHSTITLSPGSFHFYTNFIDITLTGQVFGYTIVDRCVIDDTGISNFYGVMQDTIINGDISVSTDSTKQAMFFDCSIGRVSETPNLDCGGDGAKVSVRGLTGDLLFVNKTGTTQQIVVDIYSGKVGFDSTVSAGDIVLRGVGYVYLDDSTNTTFNTLGLISPGVINDNVWDSEQAATVSGIAVEVSDIHNKLPVGNMTEIGEYTTALTNVQLDITDIHNKLPAGDIASSGEYDVDLTEIKNNIERALGLMQENYYLDNTNYIVYNSMKLMTSGRLRIYSDSASVGTSSNVLATYNITSSWSDDELTNYKVVKT